MEERLTLRQREALNRRLRMNNPVHNPRRTTAFSKLAIVGLATAVSAFLILFLASCLAADAGGRNLSPDINPELVSPKQKPTTTQSAGDDAVSIPVQQQGVGNLSIQTVGTGAALWLSFNLINALITLRQDRDEREQWVRIIEGGRRHSLELARLFVTLFTAQMEKQDDGDKSDVR